MKKRYLVSGIFLIILIAGFVLWQTDHQRIQSQKTSQTMKAQKPLPKEVTVTLNKDGFSPNEVTIKVGSAIRWKNVSGAKQTVNSDNYPTNQLHKELNFGFFTNNSTVVYIFKKPGTYGYHNQLQPTQKGKIVVIQ
jgi:plastocyanin